MRNTQTRLLDLRLGLPPFPQALFRLRLDLPRVLLHRPAFDQLKNPLRNPRFACSAVESVDDGTYIDRYS
jgi:hypothetical protein